jgi:predicted nucleic acid-binding Zn ribbon protein
VALLVVVGLVATGCGHRSSATGPTAVGSGLDSTGSGPDATTTSGGAAAGSGSAARPGSSGSAASSGSGSSKGSGGSPATNPATANPVATHATGGPGALARDLLTSQTAGRDVVELLYQSGSAPDDQAAEHVRSTLASVSGKATSAPRAAIGGVGRDWTAAQLRQLADDTTKQRQGGGQAVIHLLYLHGTFGGDTSVLGIAVRGDVVAVFKDQVAAAVTPLASEARVEDAVTMHEVGHELGLVDIVLHTGREDPSHPGHSTNKGSVMYWAIDSDLFSQVLGGPPPVNFDDRDLADLATIRSGG